MSSNSTPDPGPFRTRGHDYYTSLPRPRRSSQPALNSVPDIRSSLRSRLRSSSTSNPLGASSSVPDLSKGLNNLRHNPPSSKIEVDGFQGRPKRTLRQYLKPDPDLIFSELNQLLGNKNGRTPLREGPIRDFLDVDEIFALHDRDIMDNRERDDFKNSASRGLPVFGTPLRQVSMYASVHVPLHGESSICSYDVPLVVSTCIFELRQRNIRSPLPFRQPKSTSRTRLLLLSQSFDLPPYSSQTISSESTPDLCALLKMYTLALPEPIFSEAVSEGLWRWCIRPSLEEKDIETLENTDGSLISTAEESRIQVAALLFRLLPCANLGLLAYLINFLSSLRGEEQPDDGEPPPNPLASYTELGKLFGEAIFGRNTGIQKPILRRNKIVRGNARAVSMTVWILRRWKGIERRIPGSTVRQRSSRPASFHSPLERPSDVGPSNHSYDHLKYRDSSLSSASSRNSQIIQGPQDTISKVELDRVENQSTSSTQALDERLADAARNMHDPACQPNWVDMELPNPHGANPGAGPSSYTESLESTSVQQGRGNGRTNTSSELQCALKRIHELELELGAKRLAEVAAKEKEDLAEAKAADFKEKIASIELMLEEVRDDRKAMQSQLEEANDKVSSLEVKVTGLEGALVTMRRDKEEVGAERDAAQKLLDDIRRILSVKTRPEPLEDVLPQHFF